MAAYVNTVASGELVGGGTFTLSAHIVDDFIVIMLETVGNDPVVLTNTQGFQELPGSPVVSSSGGTRLTVYGRFATSSSMVSPTFAAASDHMAWACYTVRNARKSPSPIDAYITNSSSVNTSTGSLPSLTTTRTDNMVVAMFTGDADTVGPCFSSPTSSGGLTSLGKLVDYGTTTGNGGVVGLIRGFVDPAGPIGNTGVTIAPAQQYAAIEYSIVVSGDSVMTPVAATTTCTDVYTATGISGCTVHLDASLIPGPPNAVTSNITQWLDYSGNGRHATTVGAYAGPHIDKQNGLLIQNGGSLRVAAAVAFFAGTNAMTGTGAIPVGTYDMSVFVISRIWSSNGGRSFSNNTDGANASYNFLVGTWGKYPGGFHPAMHDNGWVGPTNARPAGDLGYGIHNAICSNSPRTVEYYYFNNLWGSHTSPGAKGADWQLSGCHYPDGGVVDETCDAHLCEVIIYNRPLNTTERNQIYGYLANKWLASGYVNWSDYPLTYIQPQTTVVDVYTRGPLVDDVVTAVAVVTTITETATSSIAPQTDIIMVQSETDTLATIASLETVAVGITSCSETRVTNEQLTSIIVSSTGETDLLQLATTVSDLIVAVTQTTEGKGYTEPLQTNIVALTYETDNPGAGGYQEFLETLVVSLLTTTDLAAFADTVLTLG